MIDKPVLASKFLNTFQVNSVIKCSRPKSPKNIKFDESPLVNQGIFEYAPESNGAEDYMSLAEEITGMKRPSDWRDRAIKAWEENQAEESDEMKEDE